MRRVLICVATVLVCACQTVAPSVQTPSGRPEKVFTGASMERVQSGLAEACMNRPAIVESNAPGQLVCSRRAEGMDAALGGLIVGGSRGSPPTFKVRFTLINLASGVRVQAYQWIESTNAFGRVDTQELNDGAQFNKVQAMLESVRL